MVATNIMNRSALDVATVETTPEGPKLAIYAKGVRTSGLWDCCPLARDQIRFGVQQTYPMRIPERTVMLPRLQKSAVETILRLSDRREPTHKLPFTMASLRALNPGIPDTLEVDLCFFSAITTLIHRSLTTDELLETIIHRVKTEDAKQIKLEIFLPHARFNSNLVQLGIRRIIESCKADDTDALKVIRSMCGTLGFAGHVNQVEKAIEEEKANARLAVAFAQEQELVKTRFAENLALAWKH